jgi:glutathione peroxidase
LNSELKSCTNEAKEVPWNFGKFLLDANGNVIKFYNPDVKPKEMKA